MLRRQFPLQRRRHLLEHLYLDPIDRVGLSPGQNHRIELTNNADGYVIADAVMITPADGLNRAIRTPTLPQAADYNVFAWWRTGT